MSGWTLTRLKEADIDTNTPTIIMGDWNTHHPDWDESINTPDPRAREIVEWLEGSNFSLCNEPYVPTREDCSGHASVINLTFKNVAENGANILSGHHIDTYIGALSDHHAIVFYIGDPKEVVYNKTSYNWNWKHTNEKEFVVALESQLAKERDT